MAITSLEFEAIMEAYAVSAYAAVNLIEKATELKESGDTEGAWNLIKTSAQHSNDSTEQLLTALSMVADGTYIDNKTELN